MKRSTVFVSFVAALAIASGSSSCSSGGGGGSPPAPPAAPTGLSASAASGAVSLAWTAASGATSYAVYRASASGALATKTRIAPALSAAAYTDTAVANGTAYYYQVTASNAAGESGGSNEVGATPSAALPPATPTGLAAYAGNASVALTWSAVPDATTYNLYWSTTPGVTPANGAKLATTATAYLHGGLTNGTPYYYVVTAESPSGESAPSPQVSATPSLAPYVRATVVSWPAPVPPDVPVLQVEVCTNVTCATPIANATVTVNGTSLPYDPLQELYAADGPTPAAGAAVNLSVTIPSGGPAAAGTYTASATQYTTFPTLTSPAAGAIWQRASDNTVTWTAGAPAAGSEYVVGIQDDQGSFYPGVGGPPVVLPTSFTSYTLPAGSIGTPGSYSVFVGIATAGIAASVPVGGIPIPGTAGGSGMFVGAVPAIVPITVQ